jgi:hypothetical protein
MMRVSRDEFHFLDSEIEAMPRLAEAAQVTSWVVIEHDGEIDAFLKVLLYRLDRSGFSDESHIENVGPAEWVQPHPVALPQFASV